MTISRIADDVNVHIQEPVRSIPPRRHYARASYCVYPKFTLLLALLGRRTLFRLGLALVPRLGATFAISTRRGGLFGLDCEKAIESALLFCLEHLGEFGCTCADTVFATLSAFESLYPLRQAGQAWRPGVAVEYECKGNVLT